MTESISDPYITVLNDRLDKICRRRYGSEEDDVVRFVLEQNPGLEREGILLTPGLKIALPDAPKSPGNGISQQVYLWT